MAIMLEVSVRAAPPHPPRLGFGLGVNDTPQNWAVRAWCATAGKACGAHPSSSWVGGRLPGASPREAMSHRLRTPGGARLYKRRGATVEPGIGNLKKILDRFSLRGMDGALNELNLAAAAFNLMKVHRAQAS